MIILFSRDSLTWFIDIFFYLQYFHDLYFTCDFSWFSFHIIHLLSCYFLPRFIYFKWKFFPHNSSHVFPIRLIYFHMNFYMIPLFFTLQMMHMWHLSAHVQFQDIQCTLHTYVHIIPLSITWGRRKHMISYEMYDFSVTEGHMVLHNFRFALF